MGAVVLEESDLAALSNGKIVKIKTESGEVIGLVTEKFLEEKENE